MLISTPYPASTVCTTDGVVAEQEKEIDLCLARLATSESRKPINLLVASCYHVEIWSLSQVTLAVDWFPRVALLRQRGALYPRTYKRQPRRLRRMEMIAHDLSRLIRPVAYARQPAAGTGWKVQYIASGTQSRIEILPR